ncbi:MAG: hypothetical protein ABI091_23375 [Ferruginibacter sp.]
MRGLSESIKEDLLEKFFSDNYNDEDSYMAGAKAMYHHLVESHEKAFTYKVMIIPGTRSPDELQEKVNSTLITLGSFGYKIFSISPMIFNGTSCIFISYCIKS